MLGSYLSVLIVFLPPIYYYIKQHISKAKYHLPPSPWKLPLIGNLHQLGSVPHQSLYRLSEIHGPLMLLQLGSVPTLVISSPDVAMEVMRIQDHNFASRPPMALAKRMFYDEDTIAFAPYSAQWRESKKICTVHLLCQKMVQSYCQVREEEVKIMVDKIANRSRSGPVNMSSVLNNFTASVVCSTIIGKGYVSQDESERNELSDIVEEIAILLGAFPLEDLFPKLGWLSIASGLRARADKCLENMDKFLDGVLKDHRIKKRNDSHHQDFVEQLLSIQQGDATLSNRFIKATIMELITAGTETTYITLEWCIIEIMRDRRVFEKVIGEIIGMSSGNEKVSEDEAARMDYLDAIVKEALRLHPPAPLLLPRESIIETQVLGYKIPSKSRVVVNAWAIGRDPTYWQDPLEFRPERFLDSGVDYKGQHFHFLPFGSGRRICPGASLAMTTIKLALANLLKIFDFEIGSGNWDEIDMRDGGGIGGRRLSPLLVMIKPSFLSSQKD